MLLSVKKFSEYSRVSTHTLRHYDKHGLLSPIARGDNKYRYYTNAQIADIRLIRALQKLGMSLKEIKDFKERRSPKLAAEVFSSQESIINANIEEWAHAKSLLVTLQKNLHSGLNADINEITIQYIPEQTIVLGDLNDYSQGKDNYDALCAFYKAMRIKYPKLDMSYPISGLFSEERIKRRDWAWPNRYYFYDSGGKDKKPAALYAVGYAHGGYGNGAELYSRLVRYIDEHGFEICGDAYEEYPLNEICVADENNYLIRGMIAVRNK